MEETKKEETPTPEKTGSGKNTTMAVVAYLLFFVPLLTESKNDPFVKFHVKQGIVLVVLSLLNAVLAAVLSFIWFAIAPLVSLAIFVLLIMGIINAVNGKMEPVPVVGKYAEQYLKF